jgi:5,10-methylenetetrahydrofolate reductase
MWDDFLRQCIHQNQKKILVVSGSPKSIQFTSVEALQYASKYRDYGLEFGVAFNPFLDDPSEYERLVQKVSSGIVSRIYFQLGDNYLLLKKGLKFCNQNFPNITKFVSILTPSERLLNSLNFRQWNGVNFSKSFLSDSKRASDINEQLIRIAAKNSAEIYLTGFLEQYTR